MARTGYDGVTSHEEARALLCWVSAVLARAREADCGARRALAADARLSAMRPPLKITIAIGPPARGN